MKKAFRQRMLIWLFAGLTGFPLALHAATYTVTTNAGTGAGSLWQAVDDANTSSGADVIQFTPGIGTISISSSPLVITDRVCINGNGQTVTSSAGLNIFFLQPGSEGSTLNGMAIYNSSGASTCIFVQSGANRIYGCAIGTDWNNTPGLGFQNGIYMVSGHYNDIGGRGPQERNVICGNTRGIQLEVGVIYGTRIRGNYLGVDSTGLNPLPNTYGIHCQTAQYSFIGGDLSQGEGNVISGNDDCGVFMYGDCLGNTVAGNIIGPSAGQTNLGDVQDAGLEVASCTYGQSIGLPQAGYHNVIAGNSQYGLLLWQQGTMPRPRRNQIRNNFIGCTDAAPNQALTNGMYALYLNGADLNVIGGDRNTLERNVIAGNTQNAIGLYLIGNANAVSGNYIGTTDGGVGALPNSAGLVIAGDGNLIGGENLGGVIRGNVVSGNDNNGVSITSGSGNTLAGNYIGLTGDGTAALGNGSRGIWLEASASFTLVGGNTTGMRNVIAGNDWEGFYAYIDNGRHRVIGNYFSLNAAGTATLPNGNACDISLNRSRYNLVQGNCLGRATIVWGVGSFGNTLVANQIGIRPDGVPTGASGGISIFNGASGNFCGQPGGQGNLITNVITGVSIGGATSVNNSIRGNTITVCSSETISLSSGGNGDKAAPVITGAASDGNIAGTALVGDIVEVFLAEGATGNGGSIRYVGEATADGGGNWSLPAGGLVNSGQYVCATGTDGGNNTSGFSTNFLVTGPTATPTPTFTATATPAGSPASTASATATLTPTVTATNALAGVSLGGKTVLAFPNPAKSRITFVFHLEQAATVKIMVYNLAGEQAAELSERFPAGPGQSLTWDCRDAAPGVYLARVLINGAEKAKLKVSVIK